MVPLLLYLWGVHGPVTYSSYSRCTCAQALCGSFQLAFFPLYVCFALVFLRQSHYAVLASDSQAQAVFLPQPFKSLDLKVFKPPSMALLALIDCCVLKLCACW